MLREELSRRFALQSRSATGGGGWGSVAARHRGALADRSDGRRKRERVAVQVQCGAEQCGAGSDQMAISVTGQAAALSAGAKPGQSEDAFKRNNQRTLWRGDEKTKSARQTRGMPHVRAEAGAAAAAEAAGAAEGG